MRDIIDILFIVCLFFMFGQFGARAYFSEKYKRSLNEIFKENGINQIE
jgi:hypothetical protein